MVVMCRIGDLSFRLQRAVPDDWYEVSSRRREDFDVWTVSPVSDALRQALEALLSLDIFRYASSLSLLLLEIALNPISM